MIHVLQEPGKQDSTEGLMPWQVLFPRQFQLFNSFLEPECKRDHPKVPSSVLVEGPRMSAKTIGTIHRVIRHMFETPGARVAMIVKITGAATDGGAWNDVVDIAMPYWLNVPGCRYTSMDSRGNPGPRIDSKTRTIFFRISNYFGGESELRLFSLNHCADAKVRFKSTRFSCVWMNELSNFEDPIVYNAIWMQLRSFHLRRHQLLWIADTNPSDQGEDSWIYKIWHKQHIDLAGLSNVAAKDKEYVEQYRRSMRVFRFRLSDNLTMDEGDRAVQRANYAHDPGEQARNCDGLWVSGHGNKGKHFADLFDRNIHVIGGGDDEGDQIAVSEDTTELFGGWDIGAVNHAVVLMEKRVVKLPSGQEVSVWNVLDELLYIGEHKTISDMGLEILEKMEAIERANGKKYTWIHYADDSALNVWRPSSGSFDYMELQIATANKIRLIGVPKPDGSIMARVRLERRLLHERRTYVSYRCQGVIAMFESLKRGSTAKDYVERDEHKHIFDAKSYVTFMEASTDLTLETLRPRAAAKTEPIYVKL